MNEREALQFSSEEMREFGYHVIDTLIDYYDKRSDRPVAGKLDYDALDAILA